MDKGKIEQIKQLSQKISLQPQQPDHYRHRSQAYVRMGEVNEAIADLSWCLMMEESCECLIERGKLFASCDSFAYAVMDYEEAYRVYEEEKSQPIHSIPQSVQEFMQNSVCIQNMEQVKNVVKNVQAQNQQGQNQPQLHELKQMLRIVLDANTKITQQLKEQQKETQDILSKYERQAKCLSQLQKCQHEQWQKVKHLQDYHMKLVTQMEGWTLSDSNKERCEVYFNVLVSEMERFYLGAKIMGEVDQKKFQFEDYSEEQCGKMKKTSQELLKKVWKVFDKNKNKIERVEKVIKELPYLGTVFKIVKSAIQAIGWVQKANTEQQCKNIVGVSPSLVSFTQLSTYLAYHFTHHYRFQITTAHSSPYRHTIWNRAHCRYQHFKHANLASKIVTSHCQEFQWAKEMGQMHSGILMVGVAYGIIMIRGLASHSSQQQEHELSHIFELIDKVELTILQSHNSPPSQKKSATLCALF